MEKDVKQEKKNKTGIIIAIIIVILLLIIGVLCYFLFFGDKIIINADGGTITQKIVVENDEITTLPIIEKDGYKVVAYVNENKQIVRKGTKVTKKTKITPVYVENSAELVTVTFYDGSQILEEIELAKGSELLLPTDPEKDEIVFGGWSLENDIMLIGTPIVNENLILRAIWISKEKEMVTVTIVSENQNGIILGKYKQEKGTNLKLPSPTKKDGYVFEEWKDDNNNVVTHETVIENDITIHAVFSKYNCPENCAVNSDGKTCTKTETKDKETKKVCPSGAFEYYGNCITLKGAGNANERQCAAGPEFGNKEVYYKNYCAKVVQRVTKKVCSSGYIEDGDKCKKATIVNCTKVE